MLFNSNHGIYFNGHTLSPELRFLISSMTGAEAPKAVMEKLRVGKTTVYSLKSLCDYYKPTMDVILNGGQTGNRTQVRKLEGWPEHFICSVLDIYPFFYCHELV